MKFSPIDKRLLNAYLLYLWQKRVQRPKKQLNRQKNQEEKEEKSRKLTIPQLRQVFWLSA